MVKDKAMVKTTQRHKPSAYELKNDSKKKAAIAARASSSVKKKTTFERPVLVVDGTEKDVDKIHRGRNASGRNWKNQSNSRSSTRASRTMISNNNNSKRTWEEKAAEQQRKKEIKERENEMRQAKIDAKKEKRRLREEQEKRRAENELKNMKVQTLTKNVDGKLKAMSKKQLRQIKKSRMNTKTGVIEYVDAYAK